jgi:pimeloyl-ACP methyl ester carboxylesterase
MTTMLDWSGDGPRRGTPVVYFHGTPRSNGRLPFPDAINRAGAHVMSPERPGYGGRSALPDATFADIARLVLTDLDLLGVDRFSVLGWSGGGPHALACAAYAPERVDAVALIASWAPMDPPDPGLPRTVRFAMRRANVSGRPILRLMLASGGHFHAGMTDDLRRVARPWGFTVEDVARATHVVAWHSEGDRQVPIGPWRAIDGVELRALPGDAHECTADAWTDAIAFAAGVTPRA